ncbi:MAG: hypothetical protein H0V00_11995 [Chloroflexia bacterium]|nr:hypothetical protein [Chloroflexia bacterium]
MATDAIDPSLTWVDYDIPADEFLVYFGGKPVPAISSPLDAPGFDDVAIMIGLSAADEKTGEIVGAQVIPMLRRSNWRASIAPTSSGEPPPSVAT